VNTDVLDKENFRMGRMLDVKDQKFEMTKMATGYLERGWVIANHKLVSFHAAFISSVLSVPADVQSKFETLRFMFVSW